MKKILVTGGTGYIGSHTTIELLQRGYNVVIIDNLSNSRKSTVERIERITGKKITFYAIDLLDRDALRNVFQSHRFAAVIHFAAAKVLADSITNPLFYYRNNVEGTINLLHIMGEKGVENLVFSSTAAIYAASEISPLSEKAICCPDTPYGRTKYMCEQIIEDTHQSPQRLNGVILRYFNPIGAHPSGLIGEDAVINSDNLLPYVSAAAVGKIPYVKVYGNDYDTIDGTGVRDFIHVVDLAQGHLVALEKLLNDSGVYHYNLGCGRGYSVLQVIKAFEKASGKIINYKISGRRPGDLGTVFSDIKKIEQEYGWHPQYDIDDMCRHAYTWEKNRSLV